MSSRRFHHLVACAAAAFSLAFGPPALAEGYAVTDLGASTYPSGINAAGVVTGTSGTRAFVYSGGSKTVLGTLGGEYSAGRAINAAGTVTGYSTRADGSYHAFAWHAGTMIDLGALGSDYSVAYAINDLGEVVGSSETAAERSHAFLYSDGRMIDLGTLGGDQPGWTTAAQGINTAGQIVGYSYLPSGDFRAFLSTGGAMQELGTLGGDWSQAYAINAAGQVTGQAYLARNVRAHAFLYSNGTLQDLGALYQYSAGTAINTAGLVVGSANVRSRSPFLDYHAVVFRDGAPVDLNRLIPSRSGWVLKEATAVNDSGQIVGYGTLRGTDHGFLLTPR